MMRVGDPGLVQPPIPIRADDRYTTTGCAEPGCDALVVQIAGAPNVDRCRWHLDGCRCDTLGSGCPTCGHLYGVWPR